MVREFLRRLVQCRLITTGRRDRGLHIIRDQDTRDPAECLEGARVTPDPVGGVKAVEGLLLLL